MKKKNILKAMVFLELFAIIILAVVAVVFAAKYSRTIPANSSTADDIRIRPYIEKEQTFYQTDGKKILMHSDTLGEIFIPAFADVPASTITQSDLTEDEHGFLQYCGSEDISSKIGIDISEHQGSIDWELVKASGIDFVIIRAGYRTYGGGIITMDNNFSANINGAEAAGLDVGVYFYSQAITPDEAIEEADAVLNAIAGKNITYPVIFDWEIISYDKARTDSVTVETLADCCVSFCERVKSAGYTPMIYQNSSTAINKLDLPRIKDYDFWVADYSSFPSFYYKYDMWQYTADGEVAGIEGPVDLNILFKDYSKE
ncbi:MAG: glycoside hydrolase family 25 protein [Ruminococcus sp.]|nr:glycoside hydrolase family 25 protein [Ruminococcus sp.]